MRAWIVWIINPVGDDDILDSLWATKKQAKKRATVVQSWRNDFGIRNTVRVEDRRVRQ